jgi:hypothetical protein
MAWLTIAILACETLICVKFSRGQFPHFTGHPDWVVYTWGAVGIGLVVFTVLYFYVLKMHLKKPDITPIREAAKIPRRERWEEHEAKIKKN